MLEPLLEAVNQLKAQIRDEKDRMCSVIAASCTSMCRDVHALVAEYACQGWFACEVQNLPQHAVAAREGHWWTVSSVWGEHGYTLGVRSTRFDGCATLHLPRRLTAHAMLTAELSGDALLIVIYSTTHHSLHCWSVSACGVPAHLWDTDFPKGVLSCWFAEASLMHVGPARVELAVPEQGGLLFFDATRGNVLRACAWTAVSCSVIRGVDDDFLVSVPHVEPSLYRQDRVRVFSRQAQLEVADWVLPCAAGRDFVFIVPRARTVRVLDFQRRVIFSCDLHTGNVVDSVAFPKDFSCLPFRKNVIWATAPDTSISYRSCFSRTRQLLCAFL